MIEVSGARAWARELGSFWDSPASLSGRHHFGETNLEHSRITLELAVRHWRRVPDRAVRKDRSLARSFFRAAALHDAGKAFDRDSHDAAGFYWLRERDLFAACLVLFHMGRWRSEAAETIVRSGMVETFEKDPRSPFLVELLQACDFTASNCYTVFHPRS